MQMFQTIGLLEVANMILFLSLGNLIFEFVSYFDIRISIFCNGTCVNYTLWA
jgi:hypothetical protein